MWDPDKQTQIDLQTQNKERDLGVLVENQLKFHSPHNEYGFQI